MAADGEPFRLTIANSLWGQTGYRFELSFLDGLAQHYGAGMNVVDFAADPEAGRQQINDWVEEKTEDRIVNLLPEGILSPLTRLVLVNAIYFNAAWDETFAEEATFDVDFHLLDGSTVRVPTMHQATEHRFAEGDGYQAVELQYDGEEVSMLLIVPEAGRFDEVDEGLDASTIAAIRAELASVTVDLSLPRFGVEQSFSLKETLEALGMAAAFDTGLADFSAMSPDALADGLHIGAVIHKAFVRVDESGTEAAAATAVIMEGNSAPLDLVVVNVDRPFVFLVQDNATGTVLFMGRVMNPEQ